MILWLRVIFSEKYQHLTTLEDLEDNSNTSGEIKSFSIHHDKRQAAP
jgi:hypothetical protein